MSTSSGKRRRRTDRMIRTFFLIMATTSILILGLIMLFLFMEGLPLFTSCAEYFNDDGDIVNKCVSFSDFLFGFDWYPNYEAEADFGIMRLIFGTLSVTVLSSLIAIPLGVMTAIYLAEIAPPKVRNIVKPMVEMLEALPSVVIGFFGLVVVAPFIQKTFGVPIGLNMFNASLMLAFMAVPTITSISEDAIYSVPLEVKEASLALGATHWQSIYKVILPASLSGITTAVILGMTRSIGETMVVLMVAGGGDKFPESIFGPVSPMPAIIASEMADVTFGSQHFHSLFAIALVLFMMTLFFNIIAEQISHRYKQVGAATL